MKRALIGGASGAVLLLILLTVWFRTGPDRVEPGDVEPDVVALFVGGQGERLEMALEFVAASPEASLVIPNGMDRRWPAANLLCAESNPNIHCPTPDPDTTRGEAAAIARLAKEHGWSTLVIVTSDYHATRAAALFDHCYDGAFSLGGADSGLSLRNRYKRSLHEWLGHVDARIVDRQCASDSPD